MSEKYARKSNTKCFICSKKIYKRPSQIKESGGRIFCGQACYGVSCRKEKPCVVCKKPILASLHKKTCSRACSNKLRTGTLYHLGSPRDKVKDVRSLKIRLFNNRGKKCERCAYNKYEILHVHHKDRDRNNNNLENLELICPNCHFEEHYLEKSWMKVVK